MMKKLAAAAAWSVLLAAGAIQPARAQCDASHYKQGEYDMFSQAAKDVAAKAFDKAIGELNAWAQKYPDSACKGQRTALLVVAYNGGKQPSKTLAAATELLAGAGPDVPAADMIRALYLATTDIASMPNPSAEDMANGEKVARALMAFDQKPKGVDDAAWATTKTQLQGVAKGALLVIAVKPGIAALAKTPPDCATAQSALAKALGDSPDNAYVAYNLGMAYRCQAKADPTKADEVYPKAVYEYIRAMVIDPTLGGTQDAKKMTDVLTNLYVNYHGGNDGLEELKAKAKASPLPPDGFTIESAAKVSERKQKEFQEKYPQLAIWMGIKGALSAPNGSEYFDSQLKNAAVPKLKGMLVEGKPACRSRELLVSVPEPDQQGTAQAVITLKLETALTGKPDSAEIQWEGVPSAFTSEPFMLTMDTENAKIEGLKSTPCTPPHAAPKKGVTKKK